MKHLRKVDRVSYIRFASVYKEFEEPEDFQRLIRETKKMKKAKKPDRRSHYADKKNRWLEHWLDPATRVICVILSLAFAVCAITSLVAGNLPAVAVMTFFCVTFMALSFKIRCLKVKVGPLQVEARFS